MSITWVVVADGSQCSIYRRQRGLELAPVAKLDHPQTRRSSPNAAVPRSTDHAHEAEVFAKVIAQALHDGRVAHSYDSLVLVAEPRFLGMLQDALDAPTRAMVRTEVHKHLTEATIPELAHQVPALLA